MSAPPPGPPLSEFPPPPPPADLARLLDAHAPLAPAPLAAEVLAFQARGLTDVWEAAERLAGRPVPSPFWAYVWPGGAALARVVLDHPEWVRGRVVLDFGSGGGVTAIAAARAGAARVLASDVDPWAGAVALLAAERQGCALEPLEEDLTLDAEARGGAVGGGGDTANGTGGSRGAAEDAASALARSADVVLCGDLCYERTVAPRIRRFLDAAAARGALVLVADAGRTYFQAEGLVELARFEMDVPVDLEGVGRRATTVYRLER